MSEDESPLEFPCEYPIKAMGAAGISLDTAVLAVIRRHAPGTASDRVRVTPSRNGRYVSVTVTITARSRNQLDAIYRDLRNHEAVLAML